MIELLQRLDQRKLYFAIGGSKVRSLERLIEGKILKDRKHITDVSKYVLSIYGTDLLYEEKIRRLLFGLIKPEKLKKAAHKFSKKSFDNHSDNALTLSLVPWRKNSELVYFIAQELSREANTVGAKSIDGLVSSYVVRIKTEIDKIREQLQNVE